MDATIWYRNVETDENETIEVQYDSISTTIREIEEAGNIFLYAHADTEGPASDCGHKFHAKLDEGYSLAVCWWNCHVEVVDYETGHIWEGKQILEAIANNPKRYAYSYS